MSIILTIIVLLFSIILHEYMHGRVAERLGDPTARLAGRLTLDPRAHIDPVGSILVPLFLWVSTGGRFLFAWAKPVPFDPFNLKNPRRDSAIISLAGPATNLAIAIIGSIVLRLLISLSPATAAALGSVFFYLVYINIILALFNLIPIAPLDGFKVVGGILSEGQAREWYGLERYGMIFLLALILPLFGNQSMLTAILSPAVEALLRILLPARFLTGMM